MQTGRPILVVDDDVKIVNLVRTYLEREGYAVVEAHDGTGALAAIREQMPALVILDVMLPEIDGLSIVRAVRRDDQTPIIILSALGSVSNRLAGLGVGADDYLTKPFSPAELVLRVKRVLARTQGGAAHPAGERALRRGSLSVDPERHLVSVDARRIDVTATELRLLVALLEADGRVLSRDQLLDAAYGADGEVMDRTVDVHIGRLRTKLGDVASGSRFIETVRGSGYRAADGTAQDVPT